MGINCFYIKIVLIVSIWYNSANCQTDSLYGSLTEIEFTNGSSVIRALEANDKYYFFGFNFQQGKNIFTIHRTDVHLQEEMLVNDVSGFSTNISAIIHIHATANKIICLIKAIDGNDIKIISLGIEFDLSNASVISEWILPSSNEISFFPRFQFDENEGVFYSIGYVINNGNKSNVLLELANTGEIIKFEEFVSNNVFVNLSSAKFSNNYFISSFNGTSSIINENLEIVYTKKNIISFIEDNITHNTETLLHNCYNYDQTINCLGRTFTETSYGSVLLNISIINLDSFTINYSIPLLSEADRIASTFSIQDNDYYYNISTGNYDPFNFTVDPNSIYVSKNKKEEPTIKEWSIKFENGKEHQVNHCIVDNEGNLLVVGLTIDNQNGPTRKNFYLKIGSDGSFVSTENPEKELSFKVYPIPNDGNFYLENSMNQNCRIEIFTFQGQKVFESNNYQLSTHESIRTNLKSGSYVLRLTNEIGLVYTEKIIVER